MKIKFEFKLFEENKENLQKEIKAVSPLKSKVEEEVEDILITVADKAILVAKKFRNKLMDAATFLADISEDNSNKAVLENDDSFFKYLEEKGYKVNKVDGKIDIVKETESFFNTIKYPAGLCSTKAFERILELSELTYEAIVKNVKRYFLEFSEEQIEKILKYDFNVWKNQNNFPDAELIDLFEYFISKLEEAK